MCPERLQGAPTRSTHPKLLRNYRHASRRQPVSTSRPSLNCCSTVPKAAAGPCLKDACEKSGLALKVPQAEAGAALRMAAATKLFELGQISSGAAAQLAGVPRTVFLSRLADFGVDTFRLTEDDLAQETRLA